MHFDPRPYLDQARQFGIQHRRKIAGAVLAALGGFAITAFGIAPLAPDPSNLPRQIVEQPVVTEDIGAQLDALAAHDLALWRTEISRGTDTAESLLRRLGATDAAAAAFVRSDATARRIVSGRGGKAVSARIAADGSVLELVARFPAERSEQARTHFTRLSIARVDGRFAAKVETAPLASQVRMGSGTITSSLFAATDASGLPDAVAIQVAEIFATDIDFHRELRKGDTFSVVYEALTADGEPVPWNEGTGRVLAAEFVNGGKTHQAVWFAGANGRGGYFGPDGTSKRRTFLASPMEFSRMTSGFAMRFHPILKTWRAHLGVDYAAPTGTPVRTVGDGTVSFAGWQNGYGNVIQVDHGGDRKTLYAHLSRIDVRKGQRVEQGQHIGAVGSTGWSTGPHLHFEFHVRGKHQDPMIIAKASEPVTLEPAARAQFASVARVMQTKLDIAETLAGARSVAE